MKYYVIYFIHGKKYYLIDRELLNITGWTSNSYRTVKSINNLILDKELKHTIYNLLNTNDESNHIIALELVKTYLNY